MSLVLKVDWTIDAIAATVLDIAARSIVGEGRAIHTTTSSGGPQSADLWWSALIDATSTALDSIAALGLTVSDIRLLVLTSADPDASLVHLDARQGRVEDAAAVETDLDWPAMFPALASPPEPVGRLSHDASTLLDLPAGLPLFIGTTVGG